MSDLSSRDYEASFPPPPGTPDATPQKRSLGCFFWGCITIVVLFVLGTTAIVGGGYYMYTVARDKFTDTQPLALTPLRLNEDERKAVKDRFDVWRDAVDKGTATEPITLDADEVNALIAEADSDDPFKDSLRVQIEDDHVDGELSLPLDDWPLPGLKGRYLNGTARLRASLEDGNFELQVDQLTVKGEAVPEEFMAELRKENLAEEIMNDPDSRETLRKLESIEIRDGRVTITPRATASPTDVQDELPGSDFPAEEGMEPSAEVPVESVL